MNIVVISDFDPTGSGYRNICIPLLKGLAELGHDIKVAALNYRGEEHTYPFSLIPATSIQDANTIAYNLNFVWNPDVYLVAMDIPLQQFFFDNLSKLGKKYVAITPLENDPLTFSWAGILLNMDFVWFISELGKQEAIRAGLTKVNHLFVGVDTVKWHPASTEEKQRLRKGLGIADDEFVVLTVADNQERKNLWAGMKAFKMLKQSTDKKVRYIMVTRVDSPVGWKLSDLALDMGITKEMMFYNRGLPDKDLWGLYAVADVYLQPSKAEGLGMPVLEAMACGIPCVATDTGALREVLEDGRGYLIPAAYEFRDVWGNSRRSMIDITKASETLKLILDRDNDSTQALEYVRNRKWEVAVRQVHEQLEGLKDEQKV